MRADISIVIHHLVPVMLEILQTVFSLTLIFLPFFI